MTQSAPASAPPPAAPLPPSPLPPAAPRRRSWLWPILAIAATAVVVWLLLHRSGAEAAGSAAQTVVAVARVDREDLIQDLWLSAEFRPFQDISLHSKVAGYLKKISVDVGDSVKSGQVIAELEIPELEDDLARASSSLQAAQQDVKRAEADFGQADAAYQRLLGVSKEHPKYVAQQELDDAKSRGDAMNGALGAAKQRVEERQSDLSKTKTMAAYASIVVPFDGIITRRYADPGALIQAGIASNTQSMPLVDLEQEDLLRLVFPVPESAAPLIQVGQPVEILVSSVDGSFRGKISRFSGKVDRNTRTMHTEVDVPNPEKRYRPGMYASARLILAEVKDALAIPVQALVSGEHPSVFVVAKDGTVEQRPVQLGLETSDRVQIREGLALGDQVVVGSRSGLRTGQKVTPKLTEAPKSQS